MTRVDLTSELHRYLKLGLERKHFCKFVHSIINEKLTNMEFDKIIGKDTEKEKEK